MNRITIADIKIKVLLLLRENGVTRASVFGSVARGETKSGSDIDLLIDFPKGKSLLDFVGLKLDLEDMLGSKVDLVEYDAIKPDLKPYILRDQIAIL